MKVQFTAWVCALALMTAALPRCAAVTARLPQRGAEASELSVPDETIKTDLTDAGELVFTQVTVKSEGDSFLPADPARLQSADLKNEILLVEDPKEEPDPFEEEPLLLETFEDELPAPEGEEELPVPQEEELPLKETEESTEETGEGAEGAGPESVSEPEDLFFSDGSGGLSDAESQSVFGELSSLQETAALSGAAPDENCASISCYGKKASLIRIKGLIPDEVQSSDDYYYLFKTDPGSGELTEPAARIKKTKAKGAFVFRVDTGGRPEAALSSYALAVKSGEETYTRISPSVFVRRPENASVNRAGYFDARTKKGLQSTDIHELVSTDSKTCFINIPASIVLAYNGDSVPYSYNGEVYYFNTITGYTDLVSECNRRGIQVTAQILLDYNTLTSDLCLADGPAEGANFYAFNSFDPAARQKMDAMFCFLSELFGQNGCFISNWILGNEINNPASWNYAGAIDRGSYLTNYGNCFRDLYNAVRSVRSSSRVFICLDYCWNTSIQGYKARYCLKYLDKYLARIQPGISWNLAYHAYAVPMTHASFWDGSYDALAQNSYDSPYIGMNNLSVLTDYVANVYGKKTRILLSEIGFSASEGQAVQAAAMALSYFRAACDPMIDAIHFRSYEDEPVETAQGLYFGISGRKALKVYTTMDSDNPLQKAAPYLLKKVGDSWKSLVPGYKKARLSGNYHYRIS